jgi:hypothetical protein
MIERICKVRDGKISIEVPFEGEVLCTIQTVPKIHSSRARRFYFGAIVRYIADYMGETTDVVHHMFTASFFPIETANPITGEVIHIGKSLSVMTKSELMELTQKAIEVAEKLNIVLPTEDQYWEVLQEKK